MAQSEAVVPNLSGSYMIRERVRPLTLENFGVIRTIFPAEIHATFSQNVHSLICGEAFVNTSCKFVNQLARESWHEIQPRRESW